VRFASASVAASGTLAGAPPPPDGSGLSGRGTGAPPSGGSPSGLSGGLFSFVYFSAAGFRMAS